MARKILLKPPYHFNRPAFSKMRAVTGDGVQKLWRVLRDKHHRHGLAFVRKNSIFAPKGN